MRALAGLPSKQSQSTVAGLVILGKGRLKERPLYPPKRASPAWLSQRRAANIVIVRRVPYERDVPLDCKSSLQSGDDLTKRNQMRRAPRGIGVHGPVAFFFSDLGKAA